METGDEDVTRAEKIAKLDERSSDAVAVQLEDGGLR